MLRNEGGGSQISRILGLEKWPRGKNICCSSRGPLCGFGSQPPKDPSQSSVAPCSGDPMPSSELHEYQAYSGAYTYMQAKHSCIKEWINLIFKTWQGISMIALPGVAISFPSLLPFHQECCPCSGRTRGFDEKLSWDSRSYWWRGKDLEGSLLRKRFFWVRLL